MSFSDYPSEIPYCSDRLFLRESIKVKLEVLRQEFTHYDLSSQKLKRPACACRGSATDCKLQSPPSRHCFGQMTIFGRSCARCFLQVDETVCPLALFSNADENCVA